jgi:hypothetical protein
MNIYQPYTYLVGWSTINKYYYGVRFAKNCNPLDFWVTYFTSSKEVKLLREQIGEPDIIEVRKTFQSKDQAFKWEQTVLKRLNVPFNERWLNRNVGGCCRCSPENNNFLTKNPMKDADSRIKLGETRKRLGLGKRSAKHLKPLRGADNPMKDPAIAARYAAKVTGRRKKLREDGTWFWHYPN